MQFSHMERLIYQTNRWRVTAIIHCDKQSTQKRELISQTNMDFQIMKLEENSARH